MKKPQTISGFNHIWVGAISGSVEKVRWRGMDIRFDENTKCLGSLLFSLGVIKTEMLNN